MNRVIHFEIHATNTERAAEFYRTIFGWEIRRWENPEADYWMIMTAPEGSKEPGIDGGISKRDESVPKEKEMVTSFVSSIQVPDLDEYITRIKSAGGTLLNPKMAIPNTGWLAYCKDMEGNIFGLFQEDKDAMM